MSNNSIDQQDQGKFICENMQWDLTTMKMMKCPNISSLEYMMTIVKRQTLVP